MAIACSCPKTLPPIEALEKADAVFVGRVVKGEVRRHPHPKIKYWEDRSFTFEVKQFWKGELQRTATVETGLNDGICGYHFIIGREYLVYARRSEEGLYTSICTRTKLWHHEGKSEVSEFGESKSPENEKEATP